MNAAKLRRVRVTFDVCRSRVNPHDAIWRSNTEERQRARSNCRAQLSVERAASHLVAHDLWRQNCGGVQPNRFAIACGSRWVGAIGRTRVDRGHTYQQRRFVTCTTAHAHGRYSAAPSHSHTPRSGITKIALPRICARGVRPRATQRVFGAQSGTRNVCGRFIGTTSGSGSSHQQSTRRSGAASVCATRGFSAGAVTRFSTNVCWNFGGLTPAAVSRRPALGTNAPLCRCLFA